jgi:hypothetical protein
MLRRKTTLLLLTALLVVLAAVRLWLYAGEGLRGQYFPDADLSGTPAAVAIDREISIATIFERWRARPPAVFSVQWSGYIHVEDSGRYTFWLTSDDSSRLYVDGTLVVQNDGVHAAQTASGALELTDGPHDVLVQYRQLGGAWALQWSWAREGQTPAIVPGRVLSTRPQQATAVWAGRLESILGVLAALLVFMAGVELWTRRPRWTSQRWLRFAGAAAIVTALAAFYLAAASEHARVVNLSKARGDQSGFLGDAEQVYANWHGLTPPGLVGKRNSMPVYAGFLSLFYDPQMSDDEYFLVARAWNIRLSLVLLVILGCVFAWHLPRMLALNLTLIVAFSVFVFKAGYSQPELLFYTFVFLTFLVFLHVLRTPPGRKQLALAIIGGLLAGVTYLTKAAVMPLVAIFIAVFLLQALVMHLRAGRNPQAAAASLAARFAPPVLLVVTCLAVLSPYLIHNKQTFGRYFYNVNTTFYVWYDNWPQASVGTILHGDGVGWPTMPEAELPSMQKYLRTHGVGDIASRLAGGFRDMVIRSFNTYWYFKYVALYAAIVIAALAVNGQAALQVVRSKPAEGLFVLAYTGVYLMATAFYEPISGTGTTRLLMSHVTPLLFVASMLLAEPAIAATRWKVGGSTITMTHVHIFVTATIALDILFVVWPRLMTTYGGF